ncbi:MAG: hypothetical protein K2H73_06020 [Treponemataceae bacterium]|nr:hypothetical protein [Treponemataceae bacterium]
MAKAKKYQRYDHYLLRGKLCHNGFERWRYAFVGTSKTTGEERAFFVELYLVNPAVSPKEPVLAQKSRLSLSEADLQYALAGTVSAENAGAELAVQPSYALVKAGVFGADGKQLNAFFAASKLSWHKNEAEFVVSNCTFGADRITGAVRVAPSEIRERPELLCSSGVMDWALRYEKVISSAPLYKKNGSVWIAGGAKAMFAGVVHIDGVEYVVSPRKSSGYIDRSWGGSLNSPSLHISSSNLTSLITGKPLASSCFAISGEFEGALRLYVNLEGDELCIHKKSPFDRFTEIHDCSPMPPDADGEKLHWTVSVHRKRLVIDVDIFCKTAEMFVRDYEAPEGERKLLKVLGGGTGFGEIRIYKKRGKDLELLEHAHVADALCEYGQVEVVGA